MVFTFKNTLKINLINLILNLSMTFSIVFGILELEESFSYTEMVAITYAILYEIIMFIVIYAGIRDRNLPEFMEIFVNGYLQLLGFIMINLLLMDTTLVGLVIASFIITFSICISIYAMCKDIE